MMNIFSYVTVPTRKRKRKETIHVLAKKQKTSVEESVAGTSTAQQTNDEFFDWIMVELKRLFVRQTHHTENLIEGLKIFVREEITVAKSEKISNQPLAMGRKTRTTSTTKENVDSRGTPNPPRWVKEAKEI